MGPIEIFFDERDPDQCGWAWRYLDDSSGGDLTNRHAAGSLALKMVRASPDGVLLKRLRDELDVAMEDHLAVEIRRPAAE